MREIKFRAYSKSYKFLFDVLEIDWDKNDVCRWNRETEHYEWFDFEDINLMQYTGLKDKNGREIYEGDLIACFNSGVSVVKYHYGTFGLELSVGDFYPFHEVYGEMEVIGNIYENPELLGDAHE